MVLERSESFYSMGNLVPSLLIAAFVAFLMIYFALFRGSNSLGKVVYVTVTMPYIVLATLLVVGLTKEGSWSGIGYFLTPQFSGEKAFYRVLTSFPIW